MNKNFGLATFGNDFGRDTSPHTAKVIKALYEITN